MILSVNLCYLDRATIIKSIIKSIIKNILLKYICKLINENDFYNLLNIHKYILNLITILILKKLLKLIKKKLTPYKYIIISLNRFISINI